jgi:predicted RNase H-like nuclease
LYKNLDILREALTNTEALSDAEKLDFQSEIETIQSQLSKEIPNKTIISQAWSTLSKVATVDGLMNVYERAKMFIIPLIS